MSDCIEYAIVAKDIILRAPVQLSSPGAGNLLESCGQFVKLTGCGRILVDLSECEYLDSTTLGQLVSLHRVLGKGNLILCCPTVEARQILLIMGLDKLLSISEEEIPHNIEYFPFVVENKNGKSEVLAAHETLSQLSQDNARKFQLLIDILNQKRESRN